MKLNDGNTISQTLTPWLSYLAIKGSMGLIPLLSGLWSNVVLVVKGVYLKEVTLISDVIMFGVHKIEL